ncbi:MAG: GNAT family N-acetyltransferase [Acidimicrobiales bacterium]
MVGHDGRDAATAGHETFARPVLANFTTDGSRSYLVREATPADFWIAGRLAAGSGAVSWSSGPGETVPAQAVPQRTGWTRIDGAEPAGDGCVTLAVEQEGTVVGMARYLRIGGSSEAAVAVAVADGPERVEIAGRLVEQLAAIAHARGIEHFVADLFTANASMLAVFVRAGFATEISVGDGVMHMSFSVDPALRDAGRPTVRAVPVWESLIGGSRRS